MQTMEFMQKNFLGKEVVVFPTDTFSKIGEVLDINEVGITVKLTYVSKEGWQYKVGDTVFFSFTNLCFKLR